MINLDYAIYQKMINLDYVIYRKIDKRSGPKLSGCPQNPHYTISKMSFPEYFYEAANI